MANGDITIYSPYEKVYDFWAQTGLEDIPAKLRDYLLMMPSRECPNPIETNDNPRARFIKYLYYDTPKPLLENLPTVEQRKSIIFDPFNPDNAPTEKGYRMYTQSIVNQSQTDGQTICRIVIGRVFPKDYSVIVGVDFYLLSNYTTEANTRDIALLRTWDMELALIHALNGVNIDGVGAFQYNRYFHSDCGSTQINDAQQNVGRRVSLAFESMGGSPDKDWQ
jgi:hypothetical protein